MPETVFETVEEAKRHLVRHYRSKRHIYKATFPRLKTKYCVVANRTIARGEVGRIWRTLTLEKIGIELLNYIYNDPEELREMVRIVRKCGNGGHGEAWLKEAFKVYPEFRLVLET